MAVLAALMDKLAIEPSAIAMFTGDPDNPTKEEARAVVRSFFAQLDWRDNAAESDGQHQRDVERIDKAGHRPALAI